MPTRQVTDQNIGFKAAFLAPRYWTTWLLIGLIGIISSLPRIISMKVGDGLGWLYRRLNTKRANIVAINLEHCFPDLNDASREQLTQDHFRFYGRSVIDLGLTWWAPEKRLARLITFKNAQQYLDTIRDHNVILLLPHMTGLDCAAGYSASLHPSITMMKPQKDALLNWRLWKGRTRIKPTRVVMRNQGLRPLIRAAKSRVACYYMPDEDFGESKLAVFAAFFNHQVSTLTTLATMARLAEAKVVPIYPIMRNDGRYEVTFDTPLENFPSGDAVNDARRVNEVIEKCISMAPAQYMWTLQWFRTRPDGEPSPYLSALK
jgi:lauroyl/myristoyl acyltransferase